MTRFHCLGCGEGFDDFYHPEGEDGVCPSCGAEGYEYLGRERQPWWKDIAQHAKLVYEPAGVGGMILTSDGPGEVDALPTVLPARSSGSSDTYISEQTMEVQAKYLDLARRAAVASSERRAYMPSTMEHAKTWYPHQWVLEAMLAAVVSKLPTSILERVTECAVRRALDEAQVHHGEQRRACIEAAMYEANEALLREKVWS